MCVYQLLTYQKNTIMKLQLSKNFNLDEFTRTSTNLTNVPSSQSIVNLILLCINVLQPLRNYLNDVVIITSGFQSVEVNKLVGGVSNSQHRVGQAADFKCDKMTKAYMYIKNFLVYDQLIVYIDVAGKIIFIHVSYNPFQPNRMQFFRKYI